MSNEDYQTVLEKAKKIIQTTENEIERNFKLGELIKEKERVLRGKGFLRELAKDLNAAYGRGYAHTNLTYMRSFYQTFRNYPELYNLAKQVSWKKVVKILGAIDIQEVAFYLKGILREGWTVTQLEKGLEKDLYGEYIAKVEADDYLAEVEGVKVHNFKSLRHFALEQPGRFSVFVGPNASGKTSIFEALDFMIHAMRIEGTGAVQFFGGEERIMNFQHAKEPMHVMLDLSDKTRLGVNYETGRIIQTRSESKVLNERFIQSFSRIFLDNPKRAENKLKIPGKLWTDGANLPEILLSIFQDESKAEVFKKKLEQYVPGFSDIHVKAKQMDGSKEIQLFEKVTQKPLTGNLISEGTYSIVALLALLYQTNQPQFLCIEEPENGLNPLVLEQMTGLFREFCEEEGHYIWLTTHSQTVVSALKPSELIVVDKIDGETKAKQVKYDEVVMEQWREGELSMDEAWLNNLLEGGLPW